MLMKFLDIKESGIVKGIKIKHLTEKISKSYIGKFTPLRFYRTYDKYVFEEDECDEYICYDVSYHYDRLEFSIAPLDEWVKSIDSRRNDEYHNINYILQNIVNGENVLDICRREVYNEVHKIEFERGEKISYKEFEKIVEKFEEALVVFTIDGKTMCFGNTFYPINSIHNAYRTVNDHVQLVFYIADCNHCKYCSDKGCVNVESEHYGSYTKLDECDDFCDKGDD